MRQELPWVRIDKDYPFDTEGGEASLADLFRGRSQLLIYHFMFDPDWDEGCPSCSGLADGFDETHLHLQNHDVAFTAVSRGPLEKLLAYRDRMGWSFPWASSIRSDFNYDFHVTIDASVAPVEYNYQDQAELEAADVTWREWSGEMPGMSAFALEDGEVYHTYSAYARGLTLLGPCGSGSTGRPSAAARATCRGSTATTSTRPATDDDCAHREHTERQEPRGYDPVEDDAFRPLGAAVPSGSHLRPQLLLRDGRNGKSCPRHLQLRMERAGHLTRQNHREEKRHGKDRYQRQRHVGWGLSRTRPVRRALGTAVGGPRSAATTERRSARPRSMRP